MMEPVAESDMNMFSSYCCLGKNSMWLEDFRKQTHSRSRGEKADVPFLDINFCRNLTMGS